MCFHMFPWLYACPPADRACYRAMVKELHEDTVSVYFVDYGYGVQVEKSDLRPITPQLLTLPFQAVRCRLAGCVFVT